MINRKGFMRYEMLSVMAVFLIVFSIVVIIAFNYSRNEGFYVMKNNALTFATTGSSYQYEIGSDTSYLVQLIDSSLFNEMKNPHGGDKYCDKYESKLEIIGGSKYVTLQCGKYLISKQKINGSEYKFYKVGRWSENKLTSDFEKKTVYTYISNNEYGMSEFYEKDLFIYMFNKKMNTNYQSIKDIKNDYKIDNKTLYRKKKLVKVESSK